MFRRALDLFPEHARSLVGLGAALTQGGDAAAASEAFARARAAIDALRRGGRGGEATLAEAFQHAVSGRPDEALDCLRTLLEKAEQPFTGWTLPIEPLFEPLRGHPAFQGLLATLAERAR
jgi:hypothetical protein